MVKGPNMGAPGGSVKVMGGTGTENISPGNDGTAAEPVMFPVVSAAKRDALDRLATKDYPGWESGNAQDLPLESVPVKKLIATQKYVHRPKVEQEKAKFRKRGGFKKEPFVMRQDGRFYLRDGHHRAQAAAEDGSPAIPVRILDLASAASPKAQKLAKKAGVFITEHEKPRLARKISDDASYAATNNVKVRANGPAKPGYASTVSDGQNYDGTAPIGKDAALADVHLRTALGNGRKRPKWRGKQGASIGGTQKSWSVSVPIMKVDDSLHVVYGWSTVNEDNGQTVTDHQGDRIETGELVKAMHDFMMSSRQGGIMHFAENGKALKGGEIVECIVFSPEVQKALGIDLKKVGAFIGYKVHDDAIWKLVKDGTLKAFSIGGSGVRVPVEN